MVNLRPMSFKSIAVIAAIIAAIAVVAADPRDQDKYKQSNGTVCGLEGTAKGSGAKALDRLKNRYGPPTDDDIDDSVTLAAVLAPGEDEDRFDATKGAEITGFVINVKPGGTETCNCMAKALIDRDTHIELALHKDAPETQRVIVEVTPRLRAQMKEKSIDWGTRALKKQLEGKWVKFTGWMMFDSMHHGQAENTNPGGAGNWRATCWEIHPVTNIEVLAGPPRGTSEVHPDVLREFHRTQAAQLKRSKERRDKLEERRKKLLEGFEKEDLEELDAHAR